MKLKLDDKGSVVVQDGKPVYVLDDGREVAHDAGETVAMIKRLNGEAMNHRQRAEAAEAKLKPFEGIEDAGAAKKALETIRNIKDGELVQAGKVEEVKAAALRASEEKYAASAKASAQREQELTALLEKRTGELNAHMIGGSFANTKLLTDDKHPLRLAIPPALAESYFGKNFKVEDGKIVPYDNNGNKIYSPNRPGDFADFDEGLEVLVRSCPFKDQIVKGSGASGGGASGSKSTGGKNVMTREQFLKMPPAAQAAAARDANTTITD